MLSSHDVGLVANAIFRLLNNCIFLSENKSGLYEIENMIGDEVKVLYSKQTNGKSLGVIDAQFLNLLRRKGEHDLAEYYRLDKRFQGHRSKLTPSGEGLPRQEFGNAPSIDFKDQDVGSERRAPLVKIGSLQREILEPEESIDEPKLKMKRSTRTSQGGSYSSFRLFDREEGVDERKPVDQETVVDEIIRDFVLYLIFLVIVNLITFGIVDHAYNYYSNVLSDILTQTSFNSSFGISRTFYEVRTIQQIWDFINGLLLKVLYEYGNDQSRSISPSKKDGVLVLFENILIGVPRIRQQRVRNDSCKVHKLYEDFFSTCYNYYTDEDEDKSPFGTQLPTAWTYTPPDKDSSRYVGKISSYGGGGYMMNITKDSSFTRGWINELMEYFWIQHGTRVVFIDFTTYTPNTNLFCVVKLVFELPPTGGVIPTANFYTMKFLRYVNTWDHIVLGCEIVFLCYIVYFTMEGIQHLLVEKEEYFQSWWNLLDLTILITAYIVIVQACQRYVTIATQMKEKVSHIEARTHASFDNFVAVQMSFDGLASLLSFLVWLKLLKFAALNKSVALILSIFNRIKWELIALSVMLFTIVMGFALLGNMLFGTNVQQFNTIWNSAFSLVGILVGGLYFYPDCEEASPYMAPVFFLLYIFIVVLLFLNVYVALIVHGFYKVVDDYEDKKERIYIDDVGRVIMYKILRLLRKGKTADRLLKRHTEKNNVNDYEDLMRVLKKHGYRGLELNVLVKKHNIVAGTPVTMEKMSAAFNDIDPKTQLSLEIDEHDRIIDQVEKISTRAEKLDNSLADIVTKVDTLVDRLLYTNE